MQLHFLYGVRNNTMDQYIFWYVCFRIFAVLIGIPMLRLSGHYFAIATLLIGISFQVVFQRWDLVGAASGCG